MSQVHQPSKQELHQQNKRSINIALSVHLRQVHPLEGTRHPIGFHPPPNRFPFATRSDSVRHPIGFRPPPDRIAFAARSDCVRHPIGLRPQSDDIPITIKRRGQHIRVCKPHISVDKISENSNVVLTLLVSALSICFVCARTKRHNNIVWANGIIASF